MMLLMPSPGNPKMVSTPQSSRRSMSRSAVVLAIIVSFPHVATYRISNRALPQALCHPGRRRQSQRERELAATLRTTWCFFLSSFVSPRGERSASLILSYCDVCKDRATGRRGRAWADARLPLNGGDGLEQLLPPTVVAPAPHPS